MIAGRLIRPGMSFVILPIAPTMNAATARCSIRGRARDADCLIGKPLPVYRCRREALNQVHVFDAILALPRRQRFLTLAP